MTARGLNRSLVALAALAFAGGCQSTGVIDPDLGSSEDTGTGGDATLDDGGTPDSGAPSRRYTPTGCTYDVSPPTGGRTMFGMDDGTFGASAAADHIHVSFAGPTDTSFAVNWRTADDTTGASQVLFGTDMAAVASADATSGTVMRQNGHWLTYESGSTYRIHEVHVCGLSASTTYYYKVGGPGHWSAVFPYSTAPAKGSSDTFTFGVAGDSRDRADIWADVLEKMSSRTIDFALHSGDFVELGPIQTQWDAWFEAAAPTGTTAQSILATTPLMPANGNHDGLAVNYFGQFALPQTVSMGEAGQGEEWYSFDYGNAHVVSINDTPTTHIAGEQATWLTADLTAVDRTTTPWIFVFHHQPAYTCSTAHAPDITVRTNLQPIFDRFNVDMVFNGHNHDYERSNPIHGMTGSEGNVVAWSDHTRAPMGTIYVVAAGAGADLYGVNCAGVTTNAVAMSIVNYATVTLAGNHLTYVAYSQDGAMLDSLDYTK